MANTPPVPKKPGVVIPMPKKPRSDQTVSFETESRPDSRTEIVVGASSARDDEDTQRTTLVDPPTGRHDPVEVRRGPPPLPKSREPDLRLQIKRFAMGELVADFFDSVEEVLLIKRGRLVLEALDSRGEQPLKNFRIELGTGQLLFEELLARHGENGIVSDFRVTAKEETEAYILTLDDLIGAGLDPIVRRARLYAVLDATSNATSESRKLRVIHREDEDGALRSIDELRQRINELTTENGGLTRQVSTLDELNRRLVTSAVQKAVRERLIELEREVRELKEQNRKQAKTIHELEATSKSQMAFVEHVTEEVLEYERLRDLLALETDDPARLIEELRRIFLQLYQCQSPRLQTLGVLGLGELGTLGVPDEALPDLSDEEVEQGISELPPSIAPADPTKNPPRGG